jgi:hypothetical protein
MICLDRAGSGSATGDVRRRAAFRGGELFAKGGKSQAKKTPKT